MKAINKVLRILVIVFGLASLALFFFTDFVTMTVNGQTEGFVGAQLAFGGEIEIAEIKADLARSADILLCFWLTAIATVMSFFSFKSKKLRYAVPGFAVIAAIYMFVINFSGAWEFVDIRPLTVGMIEAMYYTPFVLVLAIALAVFTVLAVTHLLLDDYIEVLESEGTKLTIGKRIVRFFRDYKSEGRKIVWPGIKDVIKNTVIVLIMCLIVGILIWLVDYGLSQLLYLVLGIKNGG